MISMTDTIDKKLVLAIDKVGGRNKLTSIIIHRMRELRRAGLKQDKSFYYIIEPLLDEIIENKLTVSESSKSHKK